MEPMRFSTNFSEIFSESKSGDIGLIKGMKDINAGNVKNITIIYLDASNAKLDKLKEYFEEGRLVFIDQDKQIKLNEDFYQEFGNHIEKVELINSKGDVNVLEDSDLSISGMTGEESEHLSQAVTSILQIALENRSVMREEKSDKPAKSEKSHKGYVYEKRGSSIRSGFPVKDAAKSEKRKEESRSKEIEKQDTRKKEEQEKKKAEEIEELHHRIVLDAAKNYDRKKQEKKEADKKE